MDVSVTLLAALYACKVQEQLYANALRCLRGQCLTRW